MIKIFLTREIFYYNKTCKNDMKNMISVQTNDPDVTARETIGNITYLNFGVANLNLKKTSFKR